MVSRTQCPTKLMATRQRQRLVLTPRLPRGMLGPSILLFSKAHHISDLVFVDMLHEYAQVAHAVRRVAVRNYHEPPLPTSPVRHLRRESVSLLGAIFSKLPGPDTILYIILVRTLVSVGKGGGRHAKAGQQTPSDLEKDTTTSIQQGRQSTRPTWAKPNRCNDPLHPFSLPISPLSNLKTPFTFPLAHLQKHKEKSIDTGKRH